MALQRAVGNSIAEEILFGAERRYAQGVQDGELRGELRGEQKAARSLLKRLLVQRFGTLAPDVVARIDAAKLSELDAMVPRVITAATLAEVLGASASESS